MILVGANDFDSGFQAGDGSFDPRPSPRFPRQIPFLRSSFARPFESLATRRRWGARFANVRQRCANYAITRSETKEKRLRSRYLETKRTVRLVVFAYLHNLFASIKIQRRRITMIKLSLGQEYLTPFVGDCDRNSSSLCIFRTVQGPHRCAYYPLFLLPAPLLGKFSFRPASRAAPLFYLSSRDLTSLQWRFDAFVEFPRPSSIVRFVSFSRRKTRPRSASSEEKRPSRPAELSRDQNVKVHSEKAVSATLVSFAHTHRHARLSALYVPSLSPSMYKYIHIFRTFDSQNGDIDASLFAFPTPLCVSLARPFFSPPPFSTV